MSVSSVLLVLTVAAASAVEMVEAITIVLASGIARSWRSSLEGAVLALVTLAVLVGLCGPALVNLAPIDTLRMVVGVLLLILGLQWLRKAILRASGYRQFRDEAAIFKRELEVLAQNANSSRSARDGTAFVMSYKGVFLEGVEVVLIVISFGASSGHLGLAALGATGAALIVASVGLVLSKPLARVPENAMKTGVGLMLISFGTFWAGEGAGIQWPGQDLFILVLLVGFVLSVHTVVLWLKRHRTADYLLKGD